MREPGAPPAQGDPDVVPGCSSRPREHRQRPSPVSQHQELRRAHLPHAPLTRTPTTGQRAGTRRLRQRGRSPDPSLLSSDRALWWAPFCGGDPHAHVIAAKKAGHDVGRDQVARLMAVSGTRDDERHRGVTTRAAWCRRRPRPRSAGRLGCTPPESRTGPPSAPSKGWPTSLTSSPRGAGSSAERSRRR